LGEAKELGMLIFKNIVPPIQDSFDEEDIRNMVVGRRRLSTEWHDVIHPPTAANNDWTLILPFPNTYRNAFETMVSAEVYPHVASNGRLCLYLKGVGAKEQPPQAVYDWVTKVGKYVAVKDLLALSFALDYERAGGDPNEPQTEVGALRALAKPYGSATASKQTLNAADQLVQKCLVFLNEITSYGKANCVAAMPPSDPAKEYNLPRYLAEKIACALGRENLTDYVRTVKPRDSVKALPLKAKLDTLRETIKVHPDAFKNKNVLLLDDLYQSGISMNYCALMLLRGGARRVFGLACEKTCRNDDNVGGR
jgi:hypothetical protein